ncbi:hypothetical protein [Bradyrhizobium genosp. A]|uniref:hypothetical protein n=1 Tax=Bradyrhizobium genosp. A TaxID=83626 RepID=UPI003CE6A490
MHAYVVPKESSELSLENVQAFCRAHFAGFKCLRSAEIRRQSLPLSGAGKILKAELRKAILVRQGTWVNWPCPTFECRGGKAVAEETWRIRRTTERSAMSIIVTIGVRKSTACPERSGARLLHAFQRYWRYARSCLLTRARRWNT